MAISSFMNIKLHLKHFLAVVFMENITQINN